MRTTPLHRVRCPNPWIEVCPASAKRWGLGCWVCRQIELVKPGLAESHQLGRFGYNMVGQPSKAKVIKHQKLDRHNRAVQMCLRLRGLTSGTADTIAAPIVEEFANLLTRILRNKPRRGATVEKRTTMSWRLGEARREVERKFLARAACVSVV